MAKPTALQQAIEKLETEIADRERSLSVLRGVQAQSEKAPKKERKPRRKRGLPEAADGSLGL